MMKINKERIAKFVKTMVKVATIAAVIYFSVLAITKNHEKDIKVNYIEPYCAIRYEHNVLEYKQCKDLNPQELIEYLTDEAKKKYEAPNLKLIEG